MKKMILGLMILTQAVFANAYTSKTEKAHANKSYKSDPNTHSQYGYGNPYGYGYGYGYGYRGGSKLEILECPNEGGGIYVIFGFKESDRYNKYSSNYRRPIAAKIAFHYSVADPMTCGGIIFDGDYYIKCSGYYNGLELTEFTITGRDNNITAHWATNGKYRKSIKRDTKCGKLKPLRETAL